MSDTTPTIIRGGAEIAKLLYNDKSKKYVVYELARQGKIPTFKIGASLCMRLDRFLEWSKEQETAA